MTKQSQPPLSDAFKKGVKDEELREQLRNQPPPEKTPVEKLEEVLAGSSGHETFLKTGKDALKTLRSLVESHPALVVRALSQSTDSIHILIRALTQYKVNDALTDADVQIRKKGRADILSLLQKLPKDDHYNILGVNLVERSEYDREEPARSLTLLAHEDVTPYLEKHFGRPWLIKKIDWFDKSHPYFDVPEGTLLSAKDIQDLLQDKEAFQRFLESGPVALDSLHSLAKDNPALVAQVLKQPTPDAPFCDTAVEVLYKSADDFVSHYLTLSNTVHEDIRRKLKEAFLHFSHDDQLYLIRTPGRYSAGHAFFFDEKDFLPTLKQLFSPIETAAIILEKSRSDIQRKYTSYDGNTSPDAKKQIEELINTLFESGAKSKPAQNIKAPKTQKQPKSP